MDENLSGSEIRQLPDTIDFKCGNSMQLNVIKRTEMLKFDMWNIRSSFAKKLKTFNWTLISSNQNLCTWFYYIVSNANRIFIKSFFKAKNHQTCFKSWVVLETFDQTWFSQPISVHFMSLLKIIKPRQKLKSDGVNSVCCNLI